MPDNQFDEFFNDKLREHDPSVPDGLWDKLKEAQFDQFIGDKLREHPGPVPDGLWDKIADTRFDNFFGDKLRPVSAPVPGGLWEKVTDGQFDNFFGTSLINYVAPVPDGIWEKIQPKEKDERRVFFLLRVPAAAVIILALLFGGSVAAYLWINTLKNTKKAAIETTLKKTGGNKTNQAVTPDSTTNTLIPGSQLPDQPNTNPAHMPGSLTDDEKPGTTETAPHMKKDGIISNTTIKSLKNKWQKFDLPEENQITSKIPSQTIKEINGITQPSFISSNPGDNGMGDFSPYQTGFFPAVPVSKDKDMAYGFQDLSAIKLAESRYASQMKSNVICPTNRSTGNKDWQLEIYASPDLAFKSVVNKSASQQYLLTKDSIEKMQIGFTAGFRIVKPITDNILLKTGVQYSQVNENYVYHTENEIKTTTVVTVRTIIVSPGDTLVIKDTSTLQQIGYKTNTVKNRYRSFDIPVTVGYQFGNDDLKLGINAGVIFNVSSWYEGVILDTSLAVVPLTKSNNSIYKSNIGLGLYAGFSLVKRLSDDLHIFFEPYFRYNLSNMTSSQASFNQKLNVGGLSVGLRLNLNN